MTREEARDLLHGAQTAKREIEWIAEEYTRIEALLTDITSKPFDAVSVVQSHDPDKFGRLISKKLDLEERLLDAAAVYIDARLTVAEKIKSLNNTTRDVIRSVYLDDVDIAEAASEACISYGHARNLISEAADLISESSDKI